MAVTILVPIDLSPPSRRALAYARDLGLALGKPHLILAHAYEVPPEFETFAVQQHGRPLLEALSEQAAADLDSMVLQLQDEGISSEYVARTGRPEDVILELACERACDYVVMTTHGRTGFMHAALGSVAERVVRRAPCPVVTLKAH